MRLLVITHTFPPSRHSNAKRPYYIVRACVDAGWEVEVWTSQLGMEFGEGEVFEHPNLTIRRIDDPVFRWNQRINQGSRWHRWFLLGAAGLLWPDWCAPWSRMVFKDLSKKKGEFDRVLAYVFPPSLLLAGDQSGLVSRNWVFDFQESVTPQYRLSPRRSPIQKWGAERLERLERKTLHQAGRVIFTAASNRQAYLDADLVPASVAEHIPYFYDAPIFSGASSTAAGFEIRYYGGFDLRGDRNPETFLKALSMFLERHPEARDSTRFVFHGSWLPEHNDLLLVNGLSDVVKIESSISYDDYLEGVKCSPVLLLVVAEAHNLFMPSKIVDYFGARRPILAFVPRKSEMRKVLEEAGMADFTCDETDVESGALAIARLWRLYCSKELESVGGRSEGWSSEVLVPKYLKILHEGGSSSGGSEGLP